MKKKLKLPVEDLRVESYETSRASQAAEGTVHGYEYLTLREPTCGISCDDACVTVYEYTCSVCG